MAIMVQVLTIKEIVGIPIGRFAKASVDFDKKDAQLWSDLNEIPEVDQLGYGPADGPDICTWKDVLGTGPEAREVVRSYALGVVGAAGNPCAP